MLYFDIRYLLFVAPALILAIWAQARVRSAYAEAMRRPASLSGAAAARHVLDSAGLTDVNIEQIPGQLSDHYDPRDKVLRLSQAVYASRSLAAVGIAAHEAGHAIQDSRHYAPLVIRNLAVPAAGFGSSVGILLAIVGLAISSLNFLAVIGIALYGCVVAFQLVNLPVEFDASNRAKDQLATLGIVSPQDMMYVNKVLNAAAWTYVAATLQAVLTLLYFLMRARR